MSVKVRVSWVACREHLWQAFGLVEMGTRQIYILDHAVYDDLVHVDTPEGQEVQTPEPVTAVFERVVQALQGIDSSMVYFHDAVFKPSDLRIHWGHWPEQVASSGPVKATAVLVPDYAEESTMNLCLFTDPDLPDDTIQAIIAVVQYADKAHAENVRTWASAMGREA